MPGLATRLRATRARLRRKGYTKGPRLVNILTSSVCFLVCTRACRSMLHNRMLPIRSSGSRRDGTKRCWNTLYVSNYGTGAIDVYAYHGEKGITTFGSTVPITTQNTVQLFNAETIGSTTLH